MGQDKTGAVLVVGAGIGGMQASLDLANAGFKVYLAERESAIGGVMSQLDKTFPTNDCAMCTMAPRLVEVGRHKDIEIITLSDLEYVEGEAGDFVATLTKRARYIDEEACTGCGECAEKCPVKIPSDYNLNLNNMRAVYRRYPQAIPNTFAIKKAGRPPCTFNCPAEQRAQGYIALIREKRYEEAFRVILRDNPFPSVCGRVCVHRCEDECSRSLVDDAVAVMDLKRFVADWAFDNGISSAEGRDGAPEESHKRVAIIGSGPAGLTAAYDLRQNGHGVTVFDSLPEAGGMMRVGIPAYRLPRERLDWDIANILDCGVELKTNKKVESISALFEQDFKAVFVASGAHQGYSMRIPGEDGSGILDGLVFLKDLSLGKKTDIGQRVAVIGGGNTAIDSARSALRLGKEATILYRRTRAEMPAQEEEIEAALSEGVEIKYLVAPIEVVRCNGNLESLTCVRMGLGELDESGRRRPVPIDGSEFNLQTDSMLLAIGQRPEVPFAAEGIELTPRGTIYCDPDTLATSMAGVFAGGDAVSGPAYVIDAIASGHKAAKSIDLFLKGESLDLADTVLPKVELSHFEVMQRVDGTGGRHKAAIAPHKPESGFAEVQLGFTEEQALAEADRCLNCGICSECLMCKETCKVGAVNHEMVPEKRMELHVGAVILSPGYELLSANTKLEYGYWQYPNVMAALEFERILSASGPFLGKVLRPSDKKNPKSIAFLQCVSSREDKRNYCSSICCMYATKESIIAKEHVGKDLACDIYYMDIRAYGKGFEEYYERAKELGVNYVRCRPSEIKEIEDHRLQIKYIDKDGKPRTGEYDMVVLSLGMGSPQELVELGERLGIELNEHGFCKTDHFTPIDTSRKGIFACGPFIEPKDIPETVTQASGAASRVQALLHEARNSLITPKIFPPERPVIGQRPRIGVFICHCGTNIAGVVDVPAVVDYVKELPGVVYADNNIYTCANDTQDKIRELIEEHQLNRVVVASCTPRTHEPLFRNTIREAGLNPYLFEMANIRDQCSWVHMDDHDEATAKAKDLIRMAVAKSRLLEPLYSLALPVNNGAMVLGGGIAGISAALSLADQGFPVNLVEKESELGGNFRNVHSLLGSTADPQKKLKSIIKRAVNHPNMRIWTESKATEVEGFVGNFRTTIEHKGETSEVEHGALIVATGAKESAPTEYLFGKDPRVVTQLELEGRIAGGGLEAQRIVMIQCSGSREGDRMYCSRICCSQAVKNAIRIKEISPETDIYILYREIRTYGFREEYYTKARRMGIRFVRYDLDTKPVVSTDGDRLKASVWDGILNCTLEISCDLIALAPAIVPRDDAEQVAQMLKVPLTKTNFFLEAHMKLRPVDFSVEGMFLAGLAHSPKNVDESIAQAEAAASRAAALLSQPEYVPEAIVSSVDEDMCAGCGVCVSICSFDAAEIVTAKGRKVSRVNRALCKGCGACTVACPSGAMQQLGFKPRQISEMIEAAVG